MNNSHIFDHTFWEDTIERIVDYSGTDGDIFNVFEIIPTISKWMRVNKKIKTYLFSERFANKFLLRWNFNIYYMLDILAVVADMHDSYFYKTDDSDRSLFAFPIVIQSERLFRALGVPKFDHLLEANNNMLHYTESDVSHMDMYCLYFKLEDNIFFSEDAKISECSKDRGWIMRLDRHAVGQDLICQSKRHLNDGELVVILTLLMQDKAPFVLVTDQFKHYTEFELFPDIYNDANYWIEQNRAVTYSHSAVDAATDAAAAAAPDDYVGLHPENDFDVFDYSSKNNLDKEVNAIVLKIMYHIMTVTEKYYEYHSKQNTDNTNCLIVPLVMGQEDMYRLLGIEYSVSKSLAIMNNRNNFDWNTMYNISIRYDPWQIREWTVQIMCRDVPASFDPIYLEQIDVGDFLSQLENSTVGYGYVDICGDKIIDKKKLKALIY